MNNFVTRSTSASHLGLINMKLDLLGNTILSLSRDGIRMALLRSKDVEDRRRAGILVMILTAAIGLCCTLISLKFTNEPLILQVFPNFRQSIILYFISTLLESFTEMSTIELISSGKIKEKVGIETMALIGRVGYILWSIKEMRRDPGQSELKILLESFSKGQLIYAILLNVFHISRHQSYTTSPFTILTMFKLPTQNLMRLCLALTRQNFFKYFLAQGDLFIISSFSSLKDQGVYSVISNYGSLVLRLVMQPIEEASLQYFSRELNVENPDYKRIYTYFNSWLKTMIYLALIFICFGSFFTDPVISFLLGSKWTNDSKAADALSAYCWLVGSAGISGFLESFLNAVINEKEMQIQQKLSLISSMIYCLTSIGLIMWKGSIGLIVASSINFGIRAGCNAFLIKIYRNRDKNTSDNKEGWPAIPKINLLMFLGSFLINWSLFYLKRKSLKQRISMGILLFLINIFLILKKEEKAFLESIRRMK